MFKKILFGLSILLFISCGNNQNDFSGNWIDKKNERDKIIVNKNGENYIVETRGKKFPALVKDGLLEISTETPLKGTIDANDILIINGIEYIRFEKALRPKFIGDWKNEYIEENGRKTVRENSWIRIKMENNGKFSLTQLEKDSNGNITYDKLQRHMKFSGFENDRIIFTDKSWTNGKEDNTISTYTMTGENEITITFSNSPKLKAVYKKKN